MYSKEFRARVKNLLKNTDLSFREIAIELGCSLETVYRVNKMAKIRPSRARSPNGIRASGVIRDVLIALEETHGKLLAQEYATGVDESMLVKLRAGKSSCMVETLEKLAAGAGLKLTLERIKE